MPVESEYQHTFRPLSAPSSQDVSPSMESLVYTPAGISSAGLGVTQEPPVGNKKRVVAAHKKVSFLTNSAEQAGAAKDNNKGLKFRSGYRRNPDAKMSTVYQVQYTWPHPPLSALSTPLLSAEQMLYEKRNPVTAVHTRSPADHTHRHENDATDRSGSGIEGKVNLPRPSKGDPKNRSTVNKPSKGVVDGSESKRKNELADRSKSRQPKHDVQQVLPKHRSKLRGKGQSPKSKRHRKQDIKRFVTEYQRQYGNWSVMSGKRRKSKGFEPTVLPELPRVFTDPSDPRLLKHSPLPLDSPAQLTKPDWVTVYQANFASPSEEVMLKGVSPSEPVGGSTVKDTSYSWYDQLLELRRSAEWYRKRGYGVNIGRLLPLTQEDVEDVSPSVSSSPSPTPSESVSCTLANEGASSSQVRVPTLLCPNLSSRAHRTASPCLRDESPPPPVSSNNKVMVVQDVEEISSETLSQVNSHDEPPPIPDRVRKPVPQELASSPGNESSRSNTGRIQTPTIRQDFPDFKRHHLDLTTPVGEGLLLSPELLPVEPKSTSIPVPPVSPNFRHDTRSRVPIAPPPLKPTKDECDVNTWDPLRTGYPKRSEAPRTYPGHLTAVTSSPELSRRVAVPTDGKTSSSVHKIHPGPQRTVSTSPHTIFTVPSKPDRKLYSYRVEGNKRLLPKDSCGVCGAHINASSQLRKSQVPSAHVPRNKSDVTRLTSEALDMHTRSQFRAPVASGHSHTGKPLPSSYITRLPLEEVSNRSKDVDEVSLLSLSLSSCSVASDLLKKAQERRDHFWNKPRITAT